MAHSLKSQNLRPSTPRRSTLEDAESRPPHIGRAAAGWAEWNAGPAHPADERRDGYPFPFFSPWVTHQHNSDSDSGNGNEEKEPTTTITTVLRQGPLLAHPNPFDPSPPLVPSHPIPPHLNPTPVLGNSRNSNGENRNRTSHRLCRFVVRDRSIARNKADDGVGKESTSSLLCVQPHAYFESQFGFATRCGSASASFH
ncbi:hypothetical protein K402DRAFT_403981 [Aulographum hederae CBS 113979]|uniref:Uncharacterized protein n=1 Tax=Aulographum hederae CBS 113979 TaxID=1176131 RepID=A0A6G1H1Y3_9PEZI|nr:hypothetical protein K402DRAFT_403981 [Aulographum hederae CBS 113979]